MFLYALFDPEFWWILLRGLWPVLVAMLLVGCVAGYATARFKPFNRLRLRSSRSKRFERERLNDGY